MVQKKMIKNSWPFHLKKEISSVANVLKSKKQIIGLEIFVKILK